MTAIKESNMLETIWQIGHEHYDNIDDAVFHLLECHSTESSWTPVGTLINITPLCVPYAGLATACSVCLEDLGEAAAGAVMTKCGHAFHRTCLVIMVNKVTDTANLCPQCRIQICPRRIRVPGPIIHYFDQHKANVAIHEILWARKELRLLRELFEDVFGEEPLPGWLAGNAADEPWENWDRERLRRMIH